MKRILLAISGTYPYGVAYSARARALIKLIQLSGYEIDILCDYPNYGEDGIAPELINNLFYVNESPYNRSMTFLLLPFVYTEKLKELIKTRKYDAVICRSMFDRFGLVLKVIKGSNIPLLLETCEWYDIKGFKRGIVDVRYYQFRHCMNKLYNNADGVIAISRFLENHYRLLNKKVIRIPGILDVKNYPNRLSSPSNIGLRIMFSGTVFGGKEQFSELVLAVNDLLKKGKQIEFNIFGPDKNEFLSTLNSEANEVYNNISSIIHVHGKVPQNKMVEENLNNDFGIFFRPDRRSSHAGFPTKLGEFLAAGTPVITNNTGDIGLIIKDGINGFLVDSTDRSIIYHVLDKCSSMSKDEIYKMRYSARQSALEMLDYSVYADNMKSFLNEMIH